MEPIIIQPPCAGQPAVIQVPPSRRSRTRSPHPRSRSPSFVARAEDTETCAARCRRSSRSASPTSYRPATQIMVQSPSMPRSPGGIGPPVVIHGIDTPRSRSPPPPPQPPMLCSAPRASSYSPPLIIVPLPAAGRCSPPVVVPCKVRSASRGRSRTSARLTGRSLCRSPSMSVGFAKPRSYSRSRSPRGPVSCRYSSSSMRSPSPAREVHARRMPSSSPSRCRYRSPSMHIVSCCRSSSRKSRSPRRMVIRPWRTHSRSVSVSRVSGRHASSSSSPGSLIRRPQSSRRQSRSHSQRMVMRSCRFGRSLTPPIIISHSPSYRSPCRPSRSCTPPIIIPRSPLRRSLSRRSRSFSPSTIIICRSPSLSSPRRCARSPPHIPRILRSRSPTHVISRSRSHSPIYVPRVISYSRSHSPTCLPRVIPRSRSRSPIRVPHCTVFRRPCSRSRSPTLIQPAAQFHPHIQLDNSVQ